MRTARASPHRTNPSSSPDRPRAGSGPTPQATHPEHPQPTRSPDAHPHYRGVQNTLQALHQTKLAFRLQTNHKISHRASPPSSFSPCHTPPHDFTTRYPTHTPPRPITPSTAAQLPNAQPKTRQAPATLHRDQIRPSLHHRRGGNYHSAPQHPIPAHHRARARLRYSTTHRHRHRDLSPTKLLPPSRTAARSHGALQTPPACGPRDA